MDANDYIDEAQRRLEMKDKAQIIAEVKALNGSKWPRELWTGVMFFDGERITREEFEAE